MHDFTATPIYAETDSRVSDGTNGGTSAGTGSPSGSRMQIGSNVGANGYHALLRFDTSGIPEANTITSCMLSVDVAVANTPTAGCNFGVHCAEFGTAIDENDYNLDPSNDDSGRDGSGNPADPGTRRVFLKNAFVGGVALALNASVSVVVPSRFINKGTNGMSDFTIQPDIAGVPGAGQIVTIYGPAEASLTTRKPRLTGYALTDAELNAANEYRFVAIGDETYLAYNIEETQGSPKKARTYLEITNTDFDGTAEQLISQALKLQRVQPGKMAVGRSGAAGSATFELTPERWTGLMLCFFKQVATSGPTSGQYTTDLRTAASNEVKYMTFVQRIGFLRCLYMGVLLSSMTFTCALDRIVTCDISGAGIEEWLYDQDSAGGTGDTYLVESTAAYDSTSNSMFTFVGASVTFDNGDSGDGRLVQSVTLAIRQDVSERRGLTKQRRPSGHHPGALMVEVTLTMLFENETQMRRYLGVSHRDFPMAPGCQVVFQQVEIEFEGDCNLDPTPKVRFTLPKLGYSVVRKSVPGSGPITLECSAMAALDESIDSNITVTIINTEDPSVVFAAGDEDITVFPADR